MSTTRRVFPEVFKREAVDRVISGELHPAVKAATRLNLPTRVAMSETRYRPVAQDDRAELRAIRMKSRPEHVIVLCWRKSLQPLPPHSTSMPDEFYWGVSPSGSWQCRPVRVIPLAFVSGPQVRRACDRSHVPSPYLTGAPNKPGPSEDDCFEAPTADGIHPGSSRVASLYAELVSFLGARNRDKSHSPGEQNVAPTQRE